MSIDSKVRTNTCINLNSVHDRAELTEGSEVIPSIMQNA